MKKRVPDLSPQYTEVTVCDLCGGESLQDDVLRQFDANSLDLLLALGILDLHGGCFGKLKQNFRKALGLKDKNAF